MKIFRDFLGYTSLHGLGRVEGGVYCAQKVVWVFLFLSSLGMCIYQVSRLASQYQNFQVNTNLEIQNEEKEFPGVAICNLNPVQYSSIQEDQDLMDIIDTLSVYYNVPLDSFVGSTYNASNFNITDPYQISMEDPVNKAKTAFKLRLARKPTVELEQKSQRFTDFVKSCKIHGQDCGESNFTVYRDEDYGICYSLNLRTVVYSPGDDLGLDMILNVDQNNYVPFMTESSGIKVHIYDPDHGADVATLGEAFATGFEINIGLTKKSTSRLPGRSGRCDVNNTYSNVLSCLTKCQQKQFVDQCGCAGRYDFRNFLEEIYFCKSEEDFRCMDSVKSSPNAERLCPDCKLPCQQIEYKKSISLTSWPSDNYEPILRDIIGSNFNSVKDDVLFLRVFYETLLTEIITEESAYTTENFVSDIGGQLGLWIGMSILSLAEVVELLFLLATSCCKKAKKTEDINPSIEELKQ